MMTISTLLLPISTLIMIAQTSGVRAAANAVVTVSCAHPDDDAPNYENGPFGYEDEELEITHAGGGVGDIVAHAH